MRKVQEAKFSHTKMHGSVEFEWKGMGREGEGRRSCSCHDHGRQVTGWSCYLEVPTYLCGEPKVRQKWGFVCFQQRQWPTTEMSPI
jgi:hypothetical protein